jgi:TPR repeat protein
VLDHIYDCDHPDETVRGLFYEAISLMERGPPGRARSLLQDASDRGCPEAMVMLGNILMEGEPSERMQALDMFKRAAALGNDSGMRNVGYSYALGLGCDKDKAMAVEWYRKAAEAGNARAQCNLGVMYEFGNGVAQSYEDAAEWYRRSAESGYSRGRTNMGVLLMMGLGAERDPKEAARWFALSGSPRASYNLAKLHLEGRGVPQNMERAKELLASSSEAGYAKAMFLLAKLIEANDEAGSLELYRKAAAKGNEDALAELSEESMSLPDQIGRDKGGK